MLIQHTPVKARLDQVFRQAHDHPFVRPDRVRLDGDGWLELTGRPSDIASVASHLVTADDVDCQIRGIRSGLIRVRIAETGNTHAFGSRSDQR